MTSDASEIVPPFHPPPKLFFQVPGIDSGGSADKPLQVQRNHSRPMLRFHTLDPLRVVQASLPRVAVWAHNDDVAKRVRATEYQRDHVVRLLFFEMAITVGATRGVLFQLCNRCCCSRSVGMVKKSHGASFVLRQLAIPMRSFVSFDARPFGHPPAGITAAILCLHPFAEIRICLVHLPLRQPIRRQPLQCPKLPDLPSKPFCSKHRSLPVAFGLRQIRRQCSALLGRISFSLQALILRRGRPTVIACLSGDLVPLPRCFVLFVATRAQCSQPAIVGVPPPSLDWAGTFTASARRHGITTPGVTLRGFWAFHWPASSEFPKMAQKVLR